MIYISTFKQNGLGTTLLNLPFGTLYKNEDSYSIYGNTPIGDNFSSETFTVEDQRHVFKDENDELGYMEDYTYELTRYTSFFTPDELILLFVKLIKETTVTIENSEFFLNSPIVTNGIAKVILNNCVAHIEGGEGFVKLNGLQQGSLISNNEIAPVKYHKYGSQNKKDFLKRPYFPANTEYHLKVDKDDTVIKSKTDKRGYPGSCGIENKERDVLIIIKGDKGYFTIDEVREMIAEAKEKGIKEIPITKTILLKNEDILDEDCDIGLLRRRV